MEWIAPIRSIEKKKNEKNEKILEKERMAIERKKEKENAKKKKK
jgi:hypothetical protein